LLPVACDTDSPTTPPGGEVGSLTIAMTDAPVDDIAELWVWVSGIDIKPAGGPLVRLRPPEMEGGPYDLLALRNGVSTILADAEVIAEDYQFIEIELDQERSFVVERDRPEAELPLQIASGKAKINGATFRVRPDRTTHVLFDFDAERSLTRKGNGDYLLLPALSVVAVSEGD
jgi:hypothetical protein